MSDSIESQDQEKMLIEQHKQAMNIYSQNMTNYGFAEYTLSHMGEKHYTTPESRQSEKYTNQQKSVEELAEQLEKSKEALRKAKELLENFYKNRNTHVVA